MSPLCTTLAPPRSTARKVAEPERPRRLDAEDILRGKTTAEIVLDGQVYTLRLTKQRKLLLTK